MKICELFGQGKTVFSCEVFPPKKDSPVDSIYKTLEGLKDISPDFISVTFGAGGSQVNQTTHDIAALIQNQYHILGIFMDQAKGCYRTRNQSQIMIQFFRRSKIGLLSASQTL